MKYKYFIESTERYDFVKYKNDCRNNKIISIPYKYIINLCLKHLNIKQFTNLKDFNSYRNEIDKIINYCKNLLVLTQCYETNYFSDIVINNLPELPTFILHQNQYDVMCQPVQYYQDFVIDLIEKLLLPEINKSGSLQINQALKTNQFSNIAKEILNLDNNSLIDRNKIKTISKK